MEIDLAKRYQTMLVLWFALLMSIVMYFLFSLFATPEVGNEHKNPPSSMFIFGITALATFLVIISFPVKQRFLQRSVENQDIGLVQKGMVIACAMCEVSALLGLLEHYIIRNREYYLLFILAAGGIALHFPRRSHLEAASYKIRSNLN
jgi:NADH:ubiquinone oxidoreductase subunit 2 (subunit N)